MRQSALFIVASFVGGLVAASHAQISSMGPLQSCESLAKLVLPNATITSAESVAAGFTPPARGRGRGGALAAPLPAFCRVALTIAPTPQSDIKVEVWLPLDWNGRLLEVGNGGWAGSINYGGMSSALSSGFVTASTDTGHTGGSPSFAIDRPEAVIDYGYRAVHEMTLKAKQLIVAYYSTPPQFSYWDGCSTGGKQGLTEAQRYAEDFNGIVAGAAANYMIHLHAAQTAIAQALDRTAASRIPAEKFPMIHSAVIAACDAIDGLKDGVIDDPRKCSFDPGALKCKAGDEPTCLTADQVETVRTIYRPIVHPRTHAEIFPPLMPGSEALWPTSVAQPIPFPMQTFQYVIFKNPKWDYHTFNLATDVDLADKVDAGVNNAINPNLAPFFSRGGKLLMYHGWSDHHISPINSINYYNSVLKAVPDTSVTSSSIRLLMAPGMAHCGGGDGPDTFDRIAAIRAWVESGTLPDRVIATKSSGGQVTRTRPLCAYPKVARWSGNGSIDEAANFSCVAPTTGPKPR